MAYTKPLPRVDGLNKPFWDAARQHRLLLQHCPGCGDTRFPPAPLCPKCLADGQVWIESSGHGTLESWVEMHRAYWEGFQEDLPYRVCLVRLEEGPLLVSTLVDETGEPSLGRPVKVVFDDVAKSVTLPRFTLA